MRGWWPRLNAPAVGDRAGDAANLLLRVVAGGLLFWVHGVHKAEGAIGYLGRGEAWTLLDEVRGMGTPAPVVAAVLATLSQLVMPVFVVLGLYTRPAALVLTATLLGAIVQNLTADRDPQLAILYTLAALTLGVWGAGRYSLDARPTPISEPGR